MPVTGMMGVGEGNKFFFLYLDRFQDKMKKKHIHQAVQMCCQSKLNHFDFSFRVYLIEVL
jgi:hypothetical protein